MSSSESSRRRQPRQDDRDDVQVAPFLTHVVAHHGQLTLIPPQNAGRIRKPTKKKKQAASRDRVLDDDEPRFTTAVPPSSSRKLHPAPAQVRTRKHALSNPTTPSPSSSSRRYDPIVDDHLIPDYPPPSFEDAIASPHVPSHLSSPAGASQGALEPPAQTQTETPQPLTPSLLPVSVPSSAAQTQVQTQTQQPLAPTVPSAPVPSSAAFTRTLYHSPAVSQVSLARSVEPHSISPSAHTRYFHPAPSPLALSSTTTLPSTASTESTAFSDTPLLRPPQPRLVPPSSRDQPLPAPQPREPLSSALEQVAPQRRERSQIPLDDPPAPGPRDRSPATAPYRLTSSSTTTLLSSTHALRDVPAVSPSLPTSATAGAPLPSSSPAATSQVSLLRSTQLPLPSEASPPSSPYPQSRTSVTTASDVFEDFTWDPRQRWSADRRLGFSLEERVQREFERRNTEEALTALAGGSSGSPVDNHTRRCSHCGSLRPLECNDIQSIDEASDEDLNDDDDDTSSRRSPLPMKGKSPYLHPAPSHSKATFMSRSRSQLFFKSHSPEPSSSPTSPMSPSTTSFFKNPSAWASTVTLSLSNALHNHGEKAACATSPSTKSTKRRESFGVKRLFGTLKGKEREHSRSQSLPNTALRSGEYPYASFVSSSDSSSASENIDGWEVVSVEEDSVHSPQSTHSSSSTAPTSPARSIPESAAVSPSSPTSEAARHAFLNRPLRHRSVPLDSPLTPVSPLPPAMSPIPATVTPANPPSPASARPYLPEKSPLRMLGNSQQLKQAYLQAQAANASQVNLSSLKTPVTPSPMTPSTPVTPSSPMTLPAPASGTPRALRPSPSVVWKAPLSSASRSPLSQMPTSGSPVRPSPLATPTTHTTTLPTLSSAHSPPVHPAIAALTRSEKTALRHQSAPVPTMAMTMTMSVSHESPPTTPRSGSPTAATLIRAEVPVVASDAHAHAHAPHPRKRRAATPPPSSRKATLPLHCDTTASPSRVSVSSALPAHPPASVSCPDVEEVPEPESATRERASIGQLMDTSEGQVEARSGRVSPISVSPLVAVSASVSASASVPASPVPASVSVSTPTTPTGPGSSQQHYRGRPLPRLPATEQEQESIPVKRVPDGYPVNRLPELSVGEEPPPPPASRSPSPSPRSSPSSVRAVLPPLGTPVAAAAPLTVAPMSTLSPPPMMSRSTSGGSVLEDLREGHEAPRQEFLQITDLDVLASRALEGAADGRNYEDLLLVSEVLGGASRPSPTQGEKKQTVPFTGTVEVKRRRVLKDGRVKLKLSLLGVPVDRCGACLSQFRKGEQAALTPVCKHSFHEVCLRRWLRTARVCPICRMALSMDD